MVNTVQKYVDLTSILAKMLQIHSTVYNARQNKKHCPDQK